MNQEVLLSLITIQQQENGELWEAFLPEHPLLWTVGKTEEEARTDWLRKYDVLMLYPAFEEVQRVREKNRPAEYHLDKWHKGMTDQELESFRSNAYAILRDTSIPRDYCQIDAKTLLFVQVEQVLRRLNGQEGIING